MNPIYDVIADTIVSSLETDNGAFLPNTFTVTIDDKSFLALIRGLVDTDTQKPVSLGLTEVLLEIQGHRVFVRSELDSKSPFWESIERVLH